MNRKLRDFIVGNRVEDHDAEAKRIMLAVYMALSSFFIALIFLLINLLSQVYYWVPANMIVIGIACLCLVFIKKGLFKTAKLVLVITLNVMIFWSASIDPFDDGTYLLFIPVGIGAFALLDQRNFKTAIGLALLSTTLFLLSYFDIGRNYELPPLSPQYHQVIFLLIYLLSFALSIVYVYFLVNLNYLSERELILKENFAQQKNEQLQQANKSLDQLVYSVSHDLRSPLNSILGLVDLAEQTVSRQETHRLLQLMRERIKVQKNYIQEIIEYCRNSKNETRAEKIELTKFVDEIINSLKFSADAIRIEFRKHIDAGMVLVSDRLCLWVALNNLIGNAIKYHDLTKEKPFIEIGYSFERHALYVLDNGAGILPEHQKKIFDMFYRGSSKSGGSGLGLYIIKEAVEKIGGRIEVDSRYGEGSKFEIYLNPNKPLAFRAILHEDESINASAPKLRAIL